MVIPVFIEAILSGVSVSLINKYCIQNNLFFGCCKDTITQTTEHDDAASSSTTTNDAEITHQIHAHVY
jgi:hypothetical protein